MKLSWKQDEADLRRWAAEGKMYSYAVIHDSASPYPFRVLKMRQPGGQVINSNATLSLTGAQARAQVWEDGN